MNKPKTVKESVGKLMGMLTTQFKTSLRDTPEEELIAFHHTLGRAIRNEFGLWHENPKLLSDCLKLMKRKYPSIHEELKTQHSTPRIKTLHPDEASFLIIKEFWAKMNKQLNKQNKLAKR